LTDLVTSPGSRDRKRRALDIVNDVDELALLSTAVHRGAESADAREWSSHSATDPTDGAGPRLAVKDAEIRYA